MNRGARRLLAVFAIGLLASCGSQPQAPVPPASEVPPNFPVAYYRQVAAQGGRVFRIDPSASIVTVVVRRDGSLARLGHDHVVAGHDVRGFVAPDARRADVYVRLDRLVVDEPALRTEAGFDTRPSDQDIAGTRRNMLNALDAGSYPFALISVTGVADATLRLAITLHGTTRSIDVPARIAVSGDAVDVAGELALKQTDFGITPLSVLGGAINVQDQVELRFRIRARPVEGP